MENINLEANWIWCRENTIVNDIVVFRKTFKVQQPKEPAMMYIAVDTKYWLYINGKLTVFEGGLFRESLPGCSYVDKIDVSKYLVFGENVITVLCWFYGNEGRNNINSTRAGLILECKQLGLFSDESFQCMRHPAYYNTGDPNPSYLYGGHNIGFDANKNIGDFYKTNFDAKGFESSTVFNNNLWGDLYERPIPQIKFSEIEFCTEVKRIDEKYTANLPYAMSFTPYFEVNAKGGEILNIYSDRYYVNGGPGDERNEYRGHRIEYVCKPGINKFESINYIFGEKILVDCEAELVKIGYRESGYDCEIVGRFECDCEITNKLVKKAARTLYVCMRDNFMDCPDRERGQWIGDVSVQVPQAIFLLSSEARLLIKKCISDFFNLRKENVLVGNVPGANSSELPSQSLNAISEWGIVAQYYKYTGEVDVIKTAFQPSIEYLKLWEMGKGGLIMGRNGGWRWFDHLYNVDENVLENAWYYSALRFAQKMADIMNDHQHDEFIKSRMQSIEVAFERDFWNGEYYSSGKIVDDRANAMAVLAGLCKKENYPKIRKILLCVFNSTVYMENYALTALCEMGYVKDAYDRMVARYYNLARNDNSTLWEDFYILGTKNHAWSGAPATIAFKYFMGIDTNDGFETYTVNPDKTLFKNMKCTFNAKNKIVEVSNSI